MKKLFKLSSAAIIFILVLSLFSSPILSNFNTVLAQEDSPTQSTEPVIPETQTPTEEPIIAPTLEPTALPTAIITPEITPIPEESIIDVPGFNWSILINGQSHEPSTNALEALNSLRSQDVLSEFVGSNLNLSGSRDLAQLKQAMYESLPEGFDFLGGPVSLLITFPAESGKEVIIRLEARTTTGYNWVLLPSSEFVFSQSGMAEYQQRSSGFGVPSVQTLRFTPNFSGTGTLHLVYQRAFESDLPITTELRVNLIDTPTELDLSDPLATTITEKIISPSVEGSTKAFDDIPFKGVAFPSSFDWRSYGVVPAVRNQGACGSCWAFGTVGIMESAVNIGGGGLPNLSEQMLVSCNRDGWGCNGGLTAHKYHFNTEAVSQSRPGAVYEYDMPYIGQPLGSGCLYNDKIAYTLTGWEFVTGSEFTIPTVDQIKSAIYTYGPVTAGVCAGSGWNTYSGGVYSTEDDCGGTTNHQIILVGWDDATQTWILRNSWGPSWGDDGYMHIRWNTSRVGEGTSWVKYGLSSTIPATPTLVSPVSGFLTDDPNVSLIWSEVIFGTTYDVQVDNNSDFSSSESIGDSLSETSFQPSGLQDGKYFWHVRAKNLLGQTSPWSASRYFTIDSTPPVLPVLKTPINGAQVIGTPTFTWLASATAIRYQLQYETAIDGDPETYLFRSPELTTLTYKPSATPELLVPLYWSVRAKDSLGNWSEWSAPFTVTVVPPVPLTPTITAPVSGLLTNNNPSPTFAWNTVAYAATYEMQVDDSYLFTLPLVQEHTGIAALNHGLDSLPNGKYYWRVRARNLNNAAGPWSAYRYFTVDSTPPAPPVLSTPLNGGQSIGTPTFSWLASVGAKYYQVQFDDVDDGTDTYDYLSPANGTVLTHKPNSTLPLMAPTYWQVRAGDAAGNWSGWSAPFTVTVVPPVPLTPVVTAPATGLLTNIPAPTLAWNTVAYAITYEIQIDELATFTAPIFREVSGITTLNHVIDPLLPDGKYFWRVRARNINNAAGPWSAYRYFTIDTVKPDAPVYTGPLAGSESIGTPTFTWLASVGAKYYQVQYEEDYPDTNDETYDYRSPVLTTLTHKPAVIPPLMTPIYWQVRAGDAAGNWSDWSGFTNVTVVPPPPGQPTVLTPVSNSTLEGTYFRVSWNPVDYAVWYYVEVGYDPTFESPYYYFSEPYSNQVLVGPLSQRKYYIRVIAININGDIGPWSTTREFTWYPAFNSQFNSDDYYEDWDVLSTEWTVDGGNLVFNPNYYREGWNQAAVYHSSYPTINFKDFRYRSRILMPSKVGDRYGFINREYALSGRGGYYFVVAQARDEVLGNLGCYMVYYRDYYNFTPLTPDGVYWCSPLINYDDWNTLEVRSLGSTLEFYINSVLFWKRTNLSNYPGGLGIHTSNHIPNDLTPLYVDWAVASGPVLSTATNLKVISQNQFPLPAGINVDLPGEFKIIE